MRQDTITLSGVLDFDQVARLRRDVAAGLTRADQLILDLGRVDHLSSASVAVFVDMQNKAIAMGKTMIIGPLSEAAKRVLNLFRLGAVFPSLHTER